MSEKEILELQDKIDEGLRLAEPVRCRTIKSFREL